MAAQAVSLYQEANIAALRAQGGMANGDKAMVSGYYTAGDRGGGLFIYDSGSSATDDGGLYITASGGGRWIRLLDGQVANIKMWGATKDNGSSDDTIAIQNAVNAYSAVPFSELLIPYGSYDITNTIVFSSLLHIRGEGNPTTCAITMTGEHDAFRTTTANTALSGAAFDFDHGLIFEGVYIHFATNTTNCAGLVVARPGEMSVIRNMGVNWGGYGIRVIGNGAPGLRIMNVTTHGQYVAGVSIDGAITVNGSELYVGGGNEVVLHTISGDGRADVNASLVRIYKCYPNVSIYNFKAEGVWGGGLISYKWWIGGASGSGDMLGSINIYGGTWNAGYPEIPCDLVVVSGGTGSMRTPSLHISQVQLFGVRHLIRDDLTGRTVKPYIQEVSGNQQMTARVPVLYESYILYGPTNAPERSRLVIGDSARYDLYPPTNGWYRVMTKGFGQMAGTLSIGSYYERSQVNVTSIVGGTGATDTAIDAMRKSKDNGGPRVTQARAGSYQDPQGYYWSYLDIYVERLPYAGEPITLTHPLDGQESGNGEVQLLAPTNPTWEFPRTGYTSQTVVSTSLVR